MTDQRAIVERSLKGFNAGDLDEMFSAYADDCVFWGSAEGERHGIEESKASMANVRQMFPDGRVDMASVHEDGNVVVVRNVFHGTNEGTLQTPFGEVDPTGRSVEVAMVDVYEFRDDRIARHESYYDQMQFMEQLGLIPTG